MQKFIVAPRRRPLFSCVRSLQVSINSGKSISITINDEYLVYFSGTDRYGMVVFTLASETILDQSGPPLLGGTILHKTVPLGTVP